MKNILLFSIVAVSVMCASEQAPTTKSFKVKILSVKKMKTYTSALRTLGLTGINKQEEYRDRYRHQIPEKYIKIKADIVDVVENGVLGFNRERNIVGYFKGTSKNSYQVNVKDIVREKVYEVQDIRYEKDILYFNAACIGYAKEQHGKCSTFYAYNMAKKELVWHSDYLTSNDIFILTDKLVITGYGFTAEPDYLYIFRKSDGKQLKKLKLDSAHDYLEIKGDNLHVITYNKYYVFSLSNL